MNSRVIFFVTTARSGTQWLGNTLGNLFPESMHVEHEPLGYLYQPSQTLRNAAAQRKLCTDPRIRAHFDGIHRALDSGRSYAEVGFPAFAMAPALRREFGSQLRIVQLTRNPINVAASLVTHGWYVRNRRPDLQGTVALTPESSGITLKDYSVCWKRMSAFEKALFYWYEVHRFGVELEATSRSGSFARFRFEQLKDEPSEFARLLDFMGMPARPLPERRRREKVDAFVHRTVEPINPEHAARHPRIMNLARNLGYAPEDCDPREVARRYQRHPLLVRGRMAANGVSALMSSIHTLLH